MMQVLFDIMQTKKSKEEESLPKDLKRKEHISSIPEISKRDVKDQIHSRQDEQKSDFPTKTIQDISKRDVDVTGQIHSEQDELKSDFLTKTEQNNLTSNEAQEAQTRKKDDKENQKELLKIFLEERNARRSVRTHDDIIVDGWDLAGQRIYYYTHHIYFSKRSQYILVFDLTTGIQAEVDDENLQSADNRKSRVLGKLKCPYLSRRMINISENYTCILS